MASQGPLSPAVGGDDASYGANSWGGSSAIVSSNDVRAFSSTVGGGITNYLVAQDFGFSIPDGASIDGIIVEIEKSSGSTDYVIDNRIRLRKADGTIDTTDKADTVTHWPDIEAYTSYGGTSDTWGTNWSSQNINSSNFGVAIAAYTNSSNSTARVDHVRMTVYYTANATTTSTSISTSSTSTSMSSTSASTSSTSASTSSTSSSISTSSTSTSTTTISDDSRLRPRMSVEPPRSFTIRQPQRRRFL